MRYDIFSILLLCLLFYGCPSDDEDLISLSESDRECSVPGTCEGVAVCDDGFCRCPAGVIEIAPKFCVQSSTKPTFISYDQIPGIIDTMLIEFAVEPFSHTWQNGDNYYRSVMARVYNRNPLLYGYFAIPVGAFPYPGDPNIPVDTIILNHIVDIPYRWGDQYPTGEDLSCYKQFVGYFADRNTIEGNVYIYGCKRNRQEVPDSLLPASVQAEIARNYPVTFTRIIQ